MTRHTDWAALRAKLDASLQALDRGMEPDEERLRSVLRKRAVALADRTAHRRAAADGVAALVAVVGGSRYAVQADAVAEVLPVRSVTPVPLAPPEVVGVANVRGDVCSVLDAREILGLPPAEGPLAGHLLLLRGRGKEVALLVDQVERIGTIRPAEMAPARECRCARGVLPDGTALLDVEALLDRAAATAPEEERD